MGAPKTVLVASTISHQMTVSYHTVLIAHDKLLTDSTVVSLFVDTI